jgi:tetratricopeptide (TPR) repeat protein
MNIFSLVALALAVNSNLELARDRQDRPALEKLASEASSYAASHSGDADALYKKAVAQSYLAEVALELKDNRGAEVAAESGIGAATRAVELKPGVAEYHRVLGTLCGQIIPANKFLGLKYGKCALESIDKAIHLDGKSAQAYLSRGVGNYYLPPMFGGSIDKALADFGKAIELNPKLADAHLWLGVAYRKANRLPEARASLSKAVQLNPNRIWAKQQLDKTPAK